MNTPLVYVIECNGLYKIGQTRNSIEDRIRTFQLGNPYEIRQCVTHLTMDAYLVERELHKMFSHKKIRGEWFNLDDDDIKIINGRMMDAQIDKPKERK